MEKRITIDLDKENTPAFDAEEARREFENLNPGLLELLDEHVWQNRESNTDDDSKVE